MDQECGTTGIAHYTDDGAKQCDTRFVPGAVDSQFDACLQAVDCKMSKEMHVPLEASPRTTFLEQMIPHHANAVNMVMLLRTWKASSGASTTSRTSRSTSSATS